MFEGLGVVESLGFVGFFRILRVLVIVSIVFIRYQFLYSFYVIDLSISMFIDS